MSHSPKSHLASFDRRSFSHCTDGPGAFNFGAASQYDVSLGGTGQAAKFDAEHDMILAMIKWVEKGIAPNELIGAKCAF